MDTHILDVDPTVEAGGSVNALRHGVRQVLHQREPVIGVGGLDASPTLGLCAQAFCADQVHALILPDGEISLDSARLAQSVADYAGVRTQMMSLTATRCAVMIPQGE